MSSVFGKTFSCTAHKETTFSWRFNGFCCLLLVPVDFIETGAAATSGSCQQRHVTLLPIGGGTPHIYLPVCKTAVSVIISHPASMLCSIKTLQPIEKPVLLLCFLLFLCSCLDFKQAVCCSCSSNGHHLSVKLPLVAHHSHPLLLHVDCFPKLWSRDLQCGVVRHHRRGELCIMGTWTNLIRLLKSDAVLTSCVVDLSSESELIQL